ncbi:cytochrome P450 [Plantactinospora sp. KBS50]|uniref:cytochrome P450 family protein n=1 Tax=Plantactinospora sp. KBS50 TaxID=2024580 RepID=UPI000BAB1B8A|nr:cytochrome P450 [Plantactinospora sp. KBS50]ASW57090.1 cytochrome P450 [Plantactinospora sp. KBS50]
MPSPIDAVLADPHGTFAALRERGPAHRVVLPDGSPAWLVTRYRDVHPLLADPRLSLDKRTGSGGWQGFSLPPTLDANLLNMDPPDHTRIRRLVSQAFTPRRVGGMRVRIAAMAEQLLDRLPAAGADLVTGYAGPLPVAVICDVLGVPADRRTDLRRWTGAMLSPPPDDPAASGRAVLAIERFLLDLIRFRRPRPGDDLLTAMIAARDAGDRLTEDELTSLAFLVLFAGYENSVHLIGNCLFNLLRDGTADARVREDPGLAGRAVEETLRLEPPATLAIRRFASTELTVGDEVIPAGSTVLLGIAAANRDPDVFPEPDRFRLDRADNPHLGLGHGPHYCLGAPLARLETEVAVVAFLRRFPKATLDPAADPAWRPSFRSRALRSLPVVY